MANTGKRRLHCWQVNLHHSQAASYNLGVTVGKAQMNRIVMVQEPWHHKGNVRGRLPGADLHTGHALGEVPRACMYTSKNLGSRKLVAHCSKDVVAVRVDGLEGGRRINEMVFASVYMAHDGPIPPETLRGLVQYCALEHLPLVIGCDANAHHTAWGSTDTNERGDELMEYLAESNLLWCNIGHRPTFHVQGRREVLDLTLRTDDAGELVGGWHVSDIPSLSDHAFIRFSIDLSKRRGDPRRRIRNTDWARFRSNLADAVGEVPSNPEDPEGLEGLVERLTSDINEAWEDACPVTRGATARGKRWWTPELAQERRRVRALLRTARRADLDEDWANYKEALRNLKYQIRKTKRQEWRKSCTQLDSPNAIAGMVRLLKGESSCQLGAVEKTNGQYTNTDKETLECMLDAHLRGAREPEILTIGRWSGGMVEGLLGERQMCSAVFQNEAYKSPGSDGIYPAMLQQGWGRVGPWLKVIFRASLRMGYIPKLWQNARGVFLPKPGKGSYTKTGSFRLVTLMSVLLKTLERLVLWHLQRGGIDTRLHPKQFGFRKGRSTEMALHHLVSRVEGAFINGKFALGIFLDIEGAFDGVPFSSIEAAMERLGTEAWLIGWIGHMLRNRTLEVTMGRTTVRRRITRGCPQGGVLSPLLWNAVVDELLWEFDSLPTHLQAYADDLTALLTGFDLSIMEEQAQQTINRMVNWAAEHDLRFSCLKTELVMFTNKRKWRWSSPLQMYGVDLKFGQTAKYLGVLLDAKLTWGPHIEFKTRQATACLMQCRRVIGSTWGINPSRAMWLYKTMIRPIVAHAAMVWVNALEKKVVQDRLTKFQRLACLMITSAFPGTPTAGMEAALDLPPLDLFLRGEAVKTAYRLRQYGAWYNQACLRTLGHVRSHAAICMQELNKIPVLTMPGDLQPPSLVWDLPCEIEIQGREEAIEFAQEITATGTVCFTDGSVGATGAGAGLSFYGFDPGGMAGVALGQYPTVFQTEVYALVEAARRYRAAGLQDTDITLCSDSQAALKALKNPVLKSRTVEECWNTLAELNTHNRVCLRWVPGHVGVEGNEAADINAKQGAESDMFGPEPALPIPYSLCKQEVRKGVRKAHQLRWEGLTTCRKARRAMPVIFPSNGLAIQALSRASIRLVLQALTGHGNLNRFKYATGRLDSPVCHKCGTEAETPNHHVGRCPTYLRLRVSCFGLPELTLEEIMREGWIGRLASFLREAGRLNEF